MIAKKPKTVALIPARLQSSRLPRKALADIHGMPMIVHVYKRCLLAKHLDAVYVATDSEEIRSAVENYGGRVVMTSTAHETGTDRIAEASGQLEAEIVVNVQGDEALVNPEYIDRVVEALYHDSSIDVAILVNPFGKRHSLSDIKTVLNEHDDVMYFSRADIPSDARTPNPPMLKAYHIVPFRKEFLLQYTAWNKGVLERIEYNEYLRILEKGHRIRAVRVESDALSVDTPEDLEFVREKMLTDSYYPKYRLT
ncbi:MAG: 3-deoxy-manno-octulosonate cytidylyltransferase [Nitrosomonadales bacterium]|nr:3-deoxy-manno-octulosonate cytidylyltransferase [Nitrosomonadales bacterium]